MIEVTHQDIVDRFAALHREHGKAYALEEARIAKEADSLRELCDGLGHVHRIGQFSVGSQRYCVFCSSPERK